jgi:DNA-directed RNA polymerase subunit RPC12/RpoP
MLVSGIKSRPRYCGLEPDTFAKHHLIASAGEGALAVAGLFARAPDGYRAHATILFASGASAAAGYAGPLQALGARSFHLAPTVPTLLIRLNALLAGATMGTRLYAAGTEGFIGQVTRLALGHGMDHQSISTEHRGSLARRVQCIHCKGIIEDVTTQVVACAHCGIPLLVRDHYSRRLAAFMAVSVDAEAPGEVPPAQEIYR